MVSLKMSRRIKRQEFSVRLTSYFYPMGNLFLTSHKKATKIMHSTARITVMCVTIPFTKRIMNTSADRAAKQRPFVIWFVIGLLYRVLRFIRVSIMGRSRNRITTQAAGYARMVRLSARDTASPPLH